MEHSHTYSFKYFLWPVSEVWPTKPKCFLSVLLQKRLPPPALHPLATFNCYTVSAKQSCYISDNWIITTLASSHLPISLLLVFIQDFAIQAVMCLGLSSSFPVNTVLHSALGTYTQFIIAWYAIPCQFFIHFTLSYTN